MKNDSEFLALVHLEPRRPKICAPLAGAGAGQVAAQKGCDHRVSRVFRQRSDLLRSIIRAAALAPDTEVARRTRILLASVTAAGTARKGRWPSAHCSVPTGGD